MTAGFVYAIGAASQRLHSEDRAKVIELGDTLVVVVADGAGGMRGGAAASDAFVEAVETAAAKPAFDPYDLRAWSNVLKSIDAELATGLRGETTAVVAIMGPHGIAGVTVGDSEAWLVASPRIDRLSENQDRQRLGSGRASPISFHRRTRDGVLILGTDGLFKHAQSKLIAAACAGTAADVAARLVALPRLPSGGYADDVAVVVVRAIQ